MYQLILLIFAFAALSASMPVMATDSSERQSCFYDEAKGKFTAHLATSGAEILNGSLQNSTRLGNTRVISVNGLRYEQDGESVESLSAVNTYVTFTGMSSDVRYFTPAGDDYSDFVMLQNDPRNCSWMTYHYRPELHFAWIEEDSFGLGEFLFKHSGLVVDPASFRTQGEYVRGTGFDVFSHPHKQEDGTQPRYNRTSIEVDCAGKRLRMLDQRSYAANMELTGIAGGSEKWFATGDVYVALQMLTHAICDVPREAWGEKSRLPGTLDEFSDYVHAAAHGKVM